MKHSSKWLISVLLIALVVISGCSKTEESDTTSLEVSELSDKQKDETDRDKALSVHGFLNITKQNESYELTSEDGSSSIPLLFEHTLPDVEAGSGSELRVVGSIKTDEQIAVLKVDRVEIMKVAQNTKETDWFTVENVLEDKERFLNKTITVSGRLPQTSSKDKQGNTVQKLLDKVIDEYIVLEGENMDIGNCTAWVRGTITSISQEVSLTISDYHLLEQFYAHDAFEETDSPASLTVDKLISSKDNYLNQTISITGRLPQTLIEDKQGNMVQVLWDDSLEQYVILEDKAVKDGDCKARVTGIVTNVDEEVRLQLISYEVLQ